MAGRGDESKTQSFQHVIGVVEGMDLQFAAIAGAGVHVPDGEAMAKTPERRGLKSLVSLGYHDQDLCDLFAIVAPVMR